MLRCCPVETCGDMPRLHEVTQGLGCVPAVGTAHRSAVHSPSLVAIPCRTPPSPLPRAGLKPSRPPVLVSPFRSSPSPLLLLGVEIAFQLPFAFPINPDSAIKPAGGAGREAVAGTGPLGAVASAPLPFRPRLLPALPCAAAGQGGEQELLELALPPWSTGCGCEGDGCAMWAGPGR